MKRNGLGACELKQLVADPRLGKTLRQCGLLRGLCSSERRAPLIALRSVVVFQHAQGVFRRRSRLVVSSLKMMIGAEIGGTIPDLAS